MLKSKKLSKAKAWRLVSGFIGTVVLGYCVSFVSSVAFQSVDVALSGEYVVSPWKVWIFLAHLLGVFISFGFTVLAVKNSIRLYARNERTFKAERPETRPVLVCFLSTVSPRQNFTGAISTRDSNSVFTWNFETALQANLDRLATFKRDNKENMINWNWEQILRAIAYHLRSNDKSSGLEKVILVCSKPQENQAGSIQQVREFVRFVKQFRNDQRLQSLQFLVLSADSNNPEIIPLGEGDDFELVGLDFELFNPQWNALNDLVSIIENDFKIDEEGILIDITGGQKPTSAVAASVTWNRALAVQYVQTNDPWEVLGYDIYTHD